MNASFSVAFRQVWLYFQVPSSEPPQAPAYGQICSLGITSSAKRVKCVTRPMALSPDTVVETGNHSPVLSSSQATTAFLSAGTALGIGSVSCTGTGNLIPFGPKS